MTPTPTAPLVFPDSDGQPMAENTRQYEAIVTLKGNIEVFAPPTAFVAGDHLIYVDPLDPSDRQAPDVYVAFGRPRGHRGSYKVWEEGGIFPQVIFEVLGPSNTPAEMAAKREFYFAHGAEEYYEFDPEAGTWLGFIRDPATGQPEPVANMDGHVSPRLGMRFAVRPLELLVYRPDGTRFLTFQELNDSLQQQRRRAEAVEALAEELRRQTEAERRRAEAERRRAEAVEALADELRRRVEAVEALADELRRRVEAERRRAEAVEALADELRRRVEVEQALGAAYRRLVETEQTRAGELQRELERLRERLRRAGLPDNGPPPAPTPPSEDTP